MTTPTQVAAGTAGVVTRIARTAKIVWGTLPPVAKYVAIIVAVGIGAYLAGDVHVRTITRPGTTVTIASPPSVTLEAVQAFQKSHGLYVDGVIGPTTGNAINKANGKPAIAPAACAPVATPHAVAAPAAPHPGIIPVIPPGASAPYSVFPE